MQKPILTPLLGSRTGDYLRILREYGVDAGYIPRAFVTLLISALGAPFRLYESLVAKPKLEDVAIPDPVFILGFWRSGTTYLHELMCLNDNFGYVDQYQNLFPHSAITNNLAYHLVKLSMPSTRPMDDVPLSVDSPQEEELAIAVTYRSYYTGWYFPRVRSHMFDRFVTFENASDAERTRWKRAYCEILKKASYRCGGKRLVLKNPANTGRIPTLLELFPSARYIFIVRDPYEVFLSARRMFARAWPYFTHQRTDIDLEAHVIEVYKAFMGRYLRDRDLIPDDHLLEVRYERLVSDTFSVIREIYDHLDLPGFGHVQGPLLKYLEVQRDYSPHKYHRDQEVRNRLLEEWAEFFEAFGYDERAVN